MTMGEVTNTHKIPKGHDGHTLIGTSYPWWYPVLQRGSKGTHPIFPIAFPSWRFMVSYLEPLTSWLWDTERVSTWINAPCTVLTARDSVDTRASQERSSRTLTQMVLGFASRLAVHNQVRELNSNGLIPLPVLHVVLLWRRNVTALRLQR